MKSRKHKPSALAKNLLVTSLVASALAGCNGSSSNDVSPAPKPPTPPPVESGMNVSNRLYNASWYEISQYYDGVSKYSGAMGTYTAKHIPAAVNYEGIDYFVYSDNSGGDLKLYVADSNGNRTLVATKAHVDDPHDNAVVNVIDGYVTVMVAARGTRRPGSTYRATKKNSIESFELVENHWMAYPQLWNIATIHTIYTNRRELWSKNDLCNVQLVTDGHYAVSVERDGWLHVAYNWHEQHSSDKRTNIYYMKSRDGCNWYNKDGIQLKTPVYSKSTLTRIHETDLLYLKDITVVDGEVKILAVESTSSDPTVGTRFLNVYGLDDLTPITEVGHNYNSGAFVDGLIITPTFGESNYAGGDLEVFTMDGDFIERGDYSYQYNYVRKVVNGSGAYVSETPSSIRNKGAYIRKLTYTF